MKKTSKYLEMKKKHEKETHDFEGLFFAFSNEQFAEGMQKVGLNKEGDLAKIYSIGSGVYILKSRSEALDTMFIQHNKERNELKKQEKLLFEALVYELKNHEFCITCDPTEALKALNILEKDVNTKILQKAMQEAI